MNKMIVRLPSNPLFPPQWLLMTEDGSQLDHFNDKIIGNSDICVLVPGMNVYLAEISMPQLSKSQVRKAIPFILEEQLVAKIDSYHFATDHAQNGKILYVAAISKEKMREWEFQLNIFFRLKLPLITRYVPDMLALPWDADTWSVLIEYGKVLVKTGSRSGFSIEKNEFWTLFELFLNHPKLTPPGILSIIGKFDFTDEQMKLIQMKKIQLKYREYDDLLKILSESPLDLKTMDILQGTWRKKIYLSQLKMLYQGWLWVVGIIIILSSGSILNYFILKNQMTEIQHKSIALFHHYFPEIIPVNTGIIRSHLSSDLQIQSDINLKKSFLNILSNVSDIFSHPKGIKLTGLHYEEGRLTISLESDDLEQIDKMTNSLKLGHYMVKSYNTIKTGTYVTTQIMITR